MKLLAIENETTNVNWNEENEDIINESYLIYHLFQEGIIRDIYFTEKENARIILECASKAEASNVLMTFPLVKAGLTSFKLMELLPRTGFDRIMSTSFESSFV